MKTIIQSIAAALGLATVIAGAGALLVAARLVVILVPGAIVGIIAAKLAARAGVDSALCIAAAAFASLGFSLVQCWLAKRVGVLALLANATTVVAALFFVGLACVAAPQPVKNPLTERWFWDSDGSARLWAETYSADTKFFDRPGFSAAGAELLPVTPDFKKWWLDQPAQRQRSTSTEPAGAVTTMSDMVKVSLIPEAHAEWIEAAMAVRAALPGDEDHELRAAHFERRVKRVELRWLVFKSTNRRTGREVVNQVTWTVDGAGALKVRREEFPHEWFPGPNLLENLPRLAPVDIVFWRLNWADDKVTLQHSRPGGPAGYNLDYTRWRDGMTGEEFNPYSLVDSVRRRFSRR